MNARPPSAQLAAPASAAVRRGHPWVYRDGLARAPKQLASGSVIDLSDERGQFGGRGLWDASSPIAVRVFVTDERRALDERLVIERTLRAAARRDELFRPEDDTTAYRLCNGEGDRVPGLVLDRYAETVVARTDGEAMHAWIDRLAGPLFEALRSRGIATIALRESAGKDGGARRLRTLHGTDPPERVRVRERGMEMEVDLARGHKTGAFLDQRDNRGRVRALAAGRRRALDLFSYAGGFSVAAALGGARHVTSVDTAAGAHASAQRTFRANGLDPSAHAFVTADVFAFLEGARQRGERFDLVISDPPSFAPSERARPGAIKAYRKLHAAIAHVLTDDAVLCAASCSSHVTLEDFLATLDDTALGHARVLRDAFGQPADHPTLPAWPEGRYLKFAILG